VAEPIDPCCTRKSTQNSIRTFAMLKAFFHAHLANLANDIAEIGVRG
jgi:hypothetical protein